MKLKKLLKMPNLFTPLIVAAAFAFAFRAGNIMSHWGTPSGEVGVVGMASAVETPHETNEEPPPMTTKVELEKSAQDVAHDMAAGEDDAPAGGLPGDVTSFSSSEIELLQSLSKRRDSLDAREKDIAMREALLKAAEQEIDSKLKELGKLKADMERLIGQQGKEEEARISSLVKIYENMKPADAARIFDQLDMPILLDVVGRMKERKVSPILAGMNPEKARDVTIRLAEERKLPEAGKAAVADKTPGLPQ